MTTVTKGSIASSRNGLIRRLEAIEDGIKDVDAEAAQLRERYTALECACELYKEKWEDFLGPKTGDDDAFKAESEYKKLCLTRGEYAMTTNIRSKAYDVGIMKKAAAEKATAAAVAAAAAERAGLPAPASTSSTRTSSFRLVSDMKPSTLTAGVWTL